MLLCIVGNWVVINSFVVLVIFLLVFLGDKVVLSNKNEGFIGLMFRKEMWVGFCLCVLLIVGGWVYVY